MDQFREIYFAIWATVLPLASFLAIPSIQGTTPGNILALVSVLWIPFLRREKIKDCLKVIGIFCAVWLALFALAQGGLFLFNSPRMPQLLAVDFHDTRVLLRRSIFTQTAYLLACFLTAVFFVFNYKSEWRRYIFWGAWLLAGYGIYEWVYFLVFKEPGDFIANRSFLEGEHPGSWSQIFHLGKLDLLRVKSVTGEPSFLALAGTPYLILAVESRKWVLAGALSFCLAMSLSTTAYIAIILAAVYSVYYFKAYSGKYLVWIGGAVVIGIALAFIFQDFFHVVFAQKLAGQGASGQIREHVLGNAIAYWGQLNIWNELVGIGFGSAFVTPLAGGMLLNTGLIGLALYFAGFLYPFFKLPNTPENWSNKTMLLVVLFMLTVSVADFTYLTTWMVFGLSYRRLRQMSSRSQFHEPEPPERKRRRERRRSSSSSAPAQPSATHELF